MTNIYLFLNFQYSYHILRVHEKVIIIKHILYLYICHKWRKEQYIGERTFKKRGKCLSTHKNVTLHKLSSNI